MIIRRNPTDNSRLEKKIAAYALAGAAAVIAPAAARADTIDYFPDINITVTQPGSYAFNLSGPSADDITLTAAATTIGSDAGNTINFSTANDAEVATGSGPFDTDATLFTVGEVIDPTSGSWGTSGKLGNYDTVNTDTAGEWAPGSDAYLGFYFQGGDGPQAGWAEISVGAADSSFEVLSYAYETQANTAIDAGQTSATPEPSTIALVALGGAGLIALRRRRAVRG